MYKFIALVMVMFSVSVPLVAGNVSAASFVAPTPLKMDGREKKRRSHHKKLVQKTAAVVRKDEAASRTLIEIRRTEGDHQIVLNIYYKALISQNLQQDGTNVIALGNLGNKKIVPTPEETQKDLELAERLIKDLKTEKSSFTRYPPVVSAQKNMITLNKESWSDSDIETIQKIFEERFGKQNLSIILPPGKLANEFEVPTLASSQLPPKD